MESLQGCHLFKWHKGTGNFDFSLQELKERLRKRIDELDATSHDHTPLTKAVLRTTEPSAWDCASEAVQIQATQAKDPVSDSSK